MNILVLGGTRFVGRHIVEAALERGHTLTLFHRGQSGDDLFPDVERIHGDRDGGVEALAGRSWDAVIDTCGYHPRVVRQSVEALNGRVQTYLFISTVSVYADSNPRNRDVAEDDPVIRFDQMPESEAITNETYGGFKVLCEETIRGEFEGRTIIVRPGLIIGPHDPSDRFTYWVNRFQSHGPILLPSPLIGQIQFIDAGDLATFTLDLLESAPAKAEVFNAVGPPMTYQEMMHTIRMNTDGAAEPVSVPEAWLLEQGVQPWADLPLWIPAGDPDGGIHTFDTSRARERGLETRPLAESVRAIAAWHKDRVVTELKTGISPQKEAELLDTFRESTTVNT